LLGTHLLSEYISKKESLMSEKENLIVDTKSGKIEGKFENDHYIFKGIPYAEPPVGALRWAPPQPVKNWGGVKETNDFGNIAPQTVMQMGPFGQVPQPPQSEDCLSLNIWTPGLDSARRPVMVWIHGGALKCRSFVGFSISKPSSILQLNNLLIAL
jgi:carboxylesterase type B